MKLLTISALAGVLCLGLAPARAQLPVGGPGGQMSGVLTSLFGKDSAFSASMQMETTRSNGVPDMTVLGKLSYDRTKVRFEIDLADIKGGNFLAQALDQMKAMKMDKFVVISRPDRKAMLLIYPGLNSYIESSLSETETADLKTETTSAGKETLDGHPCAKEKTVLTDHQGKVHEATVWRATDLKSLPLKIVQTEGGTITSVTFRDINATKPAASVFDAPRGATRYDSPMAMTQAMLQRNTSAAPVAPPVAPPPAPTRPRQ